MGRNVNEAGDSQAYLDKKAKLANVLTIYGRKPVLEALQSPGVKAAKLHLAASNKPASILNDIESLATQAGAEVVHHPKEALSRISKNAKQDQGVALDIQCHGWQSFDAFMENIPADFELIALDNVTNPQNLGMIVRSVCASPAYGLLLPEKGCARLDALVIKASAGTLFRCPIIRTQSLLGSLQKLQKAGTQVIGLAGGGEHQLSSLPNTGRRVIIVGNETHGISREVLNACDSRVSIAMENGVESLNVAVAASLVAYRSLFAPRS